MVFRFLSDPALSRPFWHHNLCCICAAWGCQIKCWCADQCTEAKNQYFSL